MKLCRLHALVCAFTLGAVAFVAGCNSNAHPDQRFAVYDKLAANQLRTVIVEQDRGSGVMTLSGTVGSADEKALAAKYAKLAAPGYTISNHITIQPTGLESMITDAKVDAKASKVIVANYEAALKKVRDLKDAAIRYSASKGTLYLTGSVDSVKARQEAEDLAHKVPNVQNVVNNLRVTDTES